MPSAVPNQLLACLTPTGWKAIAPLLREIDLPVNTVLYEEDHEVSDLYFLTSGFASQVVRLSDAGSVEVGVVGREGLVGSTALLGRAVAPGRCFMQASGAGYVVPYKILRQAFASSDEFRSRVLEFTQQQILTGSYLAACNKLHEAEPRFARWLLMVQDRLETDLLPLKQEFLAQMLGTRRMTVTTVAGALQRSGLIEYRRGQIRILDRAALEDGACACYGQLKELHEQLYRS